MSGRAWQTLLKTRQNRGSALRLFDADSHGNSFPDSQLQRAADAIAGGGLVAFPTDTFFALGADALSAAAVAGVFAAKRRDPGIPVPVLVYDIAMAEQVVSDFPGPLRDLANLFWPGALTIVLPASDVVPDVVTAGTGTGGLRVPDHDLARELIAAVDTPLTGTSCNASGSQPTKNAKTVCQQFGDKILVLIDVPCGENTLPSTVVGLSGNRIRLFRAGAVDIDSLRKIVGDIVVE